MISSLHDCIDSVKEPEQKGVLILTTRYRTTNVPTIIDLNGAEITEFNFTYDEKTEVDGSCALVWKNENFVFGGFDRCGQIAKIEDCGLRKIGSFNFCHRYGACANVKNEKILLCFNADPSDGDRCRSSPSPTENFEDFPRSNFGHRFTKIAALESE